MLHSISWLPYSLDDAYFSANSFLGLGRTSPGVTLDIMGNLDDFLHHYRWNCDMLNPGFKKYFVSLWVIKFSFHILWFENLKFEEFSKVHFFSTLSCITHGTYQAETERYLNDLQTFSILLLNSKYNTLQFHLQMWKNFLSMMWNWSQMRLEQKKKSSTRYKYMNKRAFDE